MIISGTHLNEGDVTALAEKLRESGSADMAGRLKAASRMNAKVFPISAVDRGAFVEALDDCPNQLWNLRASIHDQLAHEWLYREGLAA